MPLPELTAEQKFATRDQQVKIANVVEQIRQSQDQIRQLQEQIRQLAQKQQGESVKLRALIEGFATAASLELGKVSFDLDTHVFKEVPAPPAPPAATEPPAPTAPPAAA